MAVASEHSEVAPLVMREPAELSREFLVALRMYTLDVRPQWQLCTVAGVSPDVFSKLVHGRLPIRVNDPRIVRVGALLGLEAAQCFASEG